MLKDNFRLKRRDDFKKVYQKGNSTASRNLVLYWFDSNNKYPRIGFSVSKKVGNAVIRNRIKRMLRSILANRTDNLMSHDIIIIARVNILNANYETLEKEVTYLLKKSKIYRR